MYLLEAISNKTIPFFALINLNLNNAFIFGMYFAFVQVPN